MGDHGSTPGARPRFSVRPPASVGSRRRHGWRALAALCIALGAPGCEGRAKTETPEEEPLTGPSIAEIDLSRGLNETPPSSLFGPPSSRSHAHLVRTLDSLDDETVKGVFVEIGLAHVAFARAEELGRLLRKVRDAGKPVFCHAHAYDNSTYMLAAMGCSEIWLSPAGDVETIGIAAQLVFAKSLLERLNVTADFVQIGKYKGAEEPFTRDSPSPEARESLETTLAGMRTAWLDNVLEGRDDRSLEPLLEDGPHSAQPAVDARLVDHIGFEHEARAAVKKASEAVRFDKVFGEASAESPGLLDAFRSLSSDVGTPHVAVVRAVGGITMTSSPSLLGGGDGITEAALSKTLRKLREDEATKAVVIRIESPGGSALASDLLWKDLMRLREKKPLVFSVAGMAASGGYYMACAGTEIYAESTSIVGSMGVVSGKFAVGGALEDLGVHTETIAASPSPARGARAAYLSVFDPWDEPTRARVTAMAQGTYDLFLERVAEGRGRPVEDIRGSAEGRIFSGREAVERGLVDHIGGLDDAIARAIELGELPEDAHVAIVEEASSFMDLFGGDAASASRAEAEEQVMTRAKREVNPLAPVLAELPGEVAAYLSGVGALATGETTLAALPYVVLVR